MHLLHGGRVNKMPDVEGCEVAMEAVKGIYQEAYEEMKVEASRALDCELFPFFSLSLFFFLSLSVFSPSLIHHPSPFLHARRPSPKT